MKDYIWVSNSKYAKISNKMILEIYYFLSFYFDFRFFFGSFQFVLVYDFERNMRMFNEFSEFLLKASKRMKRHYRLTSGMVLFKPSLVCWNLYFVIIFRKMLLKHGETTKYVIIWWRKKIEGDKQNERTKKGST